MSYEHYFQLRAENIDDESRLRYREEIKRASADTELVATERAINRAVRQASKRDTDTAADEHGIATAPLQAEKSELKEKLRQIIIKNETPPKAMMDRLLEIEVLISKENDKLQFRLDVIRKNDAKTDREYERLSLLMSAQVPLANALVALASQELRDRQSVLANRSEWASSRLQAALKWVVTNQERIASERALRNPSEENLRIYSARLRQHQLIADDAQKEVAELHKALADLRLKMLQE